MPYRMKNPQTVRGTMSNWGQNPGTTISEKNNKEAESVRE